MALWIGSPVCAVPDDGGLALVGDADRHDVLEPNAALPQRLARDVALRGEDLLRVVLDPARLRKDLAELALRDATRPPSSSKRMARELVVP